MKAQEESLPPPDVTNVWRLWCIPVCVYEYMEIYGNIYKYGWLSAGIHLIFSQIASISFLPVTDFHVAIVAE